MAILNDFAYVVAADGGRLLDLDAVSASCAGQLARLYREPFDRLIGAQAVALEGASATIDEACVELDVTVFW